jgi:thiol-disulfide isomerase/thioredoxin
LDNNQKLFEKVQGKKMPDFILRNMDGKPILLSSFRRGNRYIVLNFWGSWNPPGRREVRMMQEYQKRYLRRVQFVNIACREEDDEEWRNTIFDLGMPGVHLKNIDTPRRCVAIRYGVEAFPTKFILDRNLRVVARFEGSTIDFYDKLDELLR